jgi:hypothetical protein
MQTDQIAIEGVNSKIFFGSLKEMEHCSDGKLRFIFKNCSKSLQ